MKKIIYFFSLIGLAVGFSGCNKILDQWKPGGGQKKQCSITKIVQTRNYPFGSDTRTGLFYYGPNNRLDSVAFDLQGGTGRAQFYYWTYDKNNRLIGYRSEYARGFYEWRHKYVWKNDKIVTDSAWLQGAGLDTFVIDNFKYDNKGRVIAETKRQVYPNQNRPDEPAEIIKYMYNEDGNLIYGQFGEIQNNYDVNVLSYISTNPAMQFVFRDFSKNSAYGAIGINAAGLPLGFENNYGLGIFGWGDPKTIEYNCR